MLDKYAELVIAGKEPGTGKVAEAPVAVAHYDIELEKQRLNFQMRQWEAERAEREEQRKIELSRIEAERVKRDEQRKIDLERIEADREERHARLEFERQEREAERAAEAARIIDERAERDARFEFERREREAERQEEAAFRTAQLTLQQQHNTLLEERERVARSKEDAKVMQLKKYGEALRNSITKLGTDTMEIIAFF